MIVYLDASVLVALFTDDALSTRADGLIRSTAPVLIVSDLAGAELASAVARKVRMGELTDGEAREAFSDFDAWTARVAKRAETRSPDVMTAGAFIRRLDLVLRAPDAIHVAIAQRLDATLATFDERMRKNAVALGLPTARI